MQHILIVDGHPIVRQGLECYFSNQNNFKIVGSLESGADIFDFLQHQPVDIIITEIDVPEFNTIKALRAIKKEYEHIKVLIFSHQPEDIYALSALKTVAAGYLSKFAPINTIVDAVNTIASGKMYLSQKMHHKINDTSKSEASSIKKLSTRETEVLKLLSIGRKNKDIARHLNISQKTVSTYKARLFKKLNVNNIVDLVHHAKRYDLA